MLKELLNELLYRIRYFFMWFAARTDAPASWARGRYSIIKVTRFAMVLLCVVAFTGNLIEIATAKSFSFHTDWDGCMAAVYLLMGIIFLLGLRAWYSLGMWILTILIIADIIVDIANLGSKLDFLALNTKFITLQVGIILVGIILLHYDRGSKLNDLLVKS